TRVIDGADVVPSAYCCTSSVTSYTKRSPGAIDCAAASARSPSDEKPNASERTTASAALATVTTAAAKDFFMLIAPAAPRCVTATEGLTRNEPKPSPCPLDRGPIMR